MATLLVVILSNAVDFGVYEYRSMQVQETAQVGAQTAWSVFYTPGNGSNAPARPTTENCAGLNPAITTAIQSTSLGDSLRLRRATPAEGY